MSIKGIDELRELPLYGAVRVNGKLYDEKLMMVSATKEQVNEIADKIEREIERDYMRLPVDADGVPIRVGDEVDWLGDKFKVAWIDSTGTEMHVGWASKNGEVPPAIEPSECTHYRKPTVEDVLRGVVTLCANTWKDERSGFSHYTVDDMMDSGNMHDFADKLREVLCDEQR